VLADHAADHADDFPVSRKLSGGLVLRIQTSFSLTCSSSMLSGHFLHSVSDSFLRLLSSFRASYSSVVRRISYARIPAPCDSCFKLPSLKIDTGRDSTAYSLLSSNRARSNQSCMPFLIAVTVSRLTTQTPAPSFLPCTKICSICTSLGQSTCVPLV
jgi:hypothetical protein